MSGKQDGYVTKRALVSGTILNGKYRIEGILGEGGFGITYAGQHKDNNCKVAIKEYFPSGLASRNYADSNQNLHIFRGENEEYQRGKKRFLNEAEILREYQYLDGIVTVMDCFECNQTAYIVMEYIEGVTLQQYIKENGCLSYQELLQLLEPVMKSLNQIHKKGLIHKDISPSNLLIGLDNQARLIDFGSAALLENRYKGNNTVILKTGYAPPEQYLVEGKQGAWTDVYAMSAMMYMALTGKTPVDSVARLQGTELQPEFQDIAGLKDWQAKALSTGMELKISDRYKNMEELLGALSVCPLKEDEHTRYQRDVSKGMRRQVRKLNQGDRPFRKSVIVFVILMLFGVIVWNVWKQDKAISKENETITQSDLETTASASATTEESMEILCVMPDVVGKSETEARKLIREADTQIGIIVNEVYSEEIEMGFVIAQDIAADTKYNQGAVKEVILTVSKGIEATTEATTQSNTTASYKKSSNATKSKEDDTYIEFEEDDEYDEFIVE